MIRSNEDKKSILNMPGDELSATMKRLSRYTLAVEMIPIGACLPLFSRNESLLLGGLAFVLFIGLFFMRFCDERKNLKWNIIEILQCILALLDIVAFILNGKTGGNLFSIVILYASFAFLWIHCALCVFDFRKEEQIPFMRFWGAITVVLTVLVCYLISNWLDFNTFESNFLHGFELGF